MNKMSYVEFIRTSTPGPYGIPLKVVEQDEKVILFEIEIDDVRHSFSIGTNDILNNIASPEQDGLYLLEISPESMAKLYSKISNVVKSEKNQFIL
jgi:hypothetical protein